MREIKMRFACGLGGITGWEDEYSPLYSVMAKQSNWATPEQNQKLSQELLLVYRNYLLAIAADHDGMY